MEDLQSDRLCFQYAPDASDAAAICTQLADFEKLAADRAKQERAIGVRLELP